MKRAVIYCRTSTTEESQVNALENQVEEAKSCVKAQGWLLVDTYVESRSGTTTQGRIQYSRLYEELLEDKFDIIVIKSQDRLMRNVKDWYLFLDRMIRGGKRLYIYIERKFYETDDALITGIKAILAEDYSRELSKKINNAHKNRQQKGGKIILNSRAFGLQKNPDGTISLRENEADMIRRMYEYCADGYGCRAIANIFENEGKTNSRGRYLEPADIRKIIRNPLYKGTAVMNRIHFDFDTKKTRKNPKSEWRYKENAVPPIVDEALWKRANQAMTKRAADANRNGSYARGSNPGKYQLSGKIFCGLCGAPYYRAQRCKGKKASSIVKEWKCKNYLEHGRNAETRSSRFRKFSEDLKKGCDNVHIEEAVLFQVLEKACIQYYHWTDEEKSGLLQHMASLLEKVLSENPVQERIALLEQQEAEIQRKKETLLSKLLDSVITNEVYRRKNEEFDAQLLKLAKEKEALLPELWQKEQLKERIAAIKSRLEDKGLNQAAVYQMIADIDRIIVHEWELEIRFDPLKLAGLFHKKQENEAIFSEITKEFTIFLPYPFSPETERGRYLDRLRIMEELREHPDTTCRKMAEKFHRNLTMIQSRVRELKAGGYIRYQGKGGHGYWEILKELPDVRKWKNRPT